MHRRGHPRGRRWRHLRHFVREVKRRGMWPRVIVWKLHRRVFAWIAASILTTAVVVGLTTHLLDHAARARGWQIALPLAVAVAVLWAVAGKISWRLTRPLYMVVDVAERLGQGDLKARARVMGHRREERALAAALNRMADRIERQMADQRELLAQVSHELRTPLGHLRLLLEMAREKPDAGTLDEFEKEIAEIDSLVGDLLASSRLTFDALNLRELDARELAARALDRAGIPADKLHVEGAPRVRADATLLMRALANLLENAKVHGGGVERLAVNARAGQVQFAVADCGPGFAEGDAPRAFDAFFHRPRGENGEAGSLGLGLALVQRIAQAHGGTATARNRDGGGAEVAFSIAGAANLPAASASLPEQSARERA